MLEIKVFQLQRRINGVEVAAGAFFERLVPSFPFDDDATFESCSKNNAIVFKKPNREGTHIEDAKMVNGQWLIAGTSGVVLVVVAAVKS